MLKKILFQLNIVGQCRKYGLSLWQCPQFLFLAMGLIIISTALGFYLIGTHYISDPSSVALIDISLSAVLFIISFAINRSFERLAEVSMMKSEFIDIVSHQLRSPITNIKWITDFLTSEGIKITAEKREEYFNHLQENTQRMVELVDELLIVSKIEHGTFPMKKREESLGKLIKELISRSKVLIEASKLKLSFRQQKNLPKTFFDYTLMKLVVENLIDNAVHYTKKGGKIDIELKKKKNKLLFKIKDTGIGIPKEEQKDIFKKFFRAENALKEKTQGTGLGLYICKLIIEKLKGKVWFVSEKNKGTTFYFTLPLK